MVENKKLIYRFGDVLYLKKINELKLVNYIVSSFSKTKKAISSEQAAAITKTLEQHPYYIQQYCNILWQNVQRSVSDNEIKECFNDLIEYNSGQFDLIIRNLSITQLNFLRALSNGESSFHSQKVLEKYQLGSSANVTAIKKALLEKEILTEENGIYNFSDPVLAIYFKQLYDHY